MNKRGFTLIELIAILTVISIMMVIIFPQIQSTISDRKESQYANIITTIKDAAKVYYADNQTANRVDISTLVNEYYLSSGLTNPVTEEAIGGCILIEEDEEGFNKYTYYDDCSSLVEYSITNLVSNGSFEEGENNWNRVHGDFSTTKPRTGNYSIYVDDPNTSDSYWSWTEDKSIINGHIYYSGVYVNIISYTSTNSEGAFGFIFKNNSSDLISISGTITEAIFNPNADYEKKSIVYNSTITNIVIFLGSWSTAISQYYYDDVFLIDLTATFGAGNEPTKAWCDANLNYVEDYSFVYLNL